MMARMMVILFCLTMLNKKKWVAYKVRMALNKFE
jgi:hypothetical protein